MTDQKMRFGAAAAGTSSSDPMLDEYIQQIREIGLARFVGRINAGVISPESGYEAVERFVALEKRRPFVSRIAQFIVGSPDSRIADFK